MDVREWGFLLSNALGQGIDTLLGWGFGARDETAEYPD